jgi:hypothetical protein
MDIWLFAVISEQSGARSTTRAEAREDLRSNLRLADLAVAEEQEGTRSASGPATTCGLRPEGQTPDTLTRRYVFPGGL